MSAVEKFKAAKEIVHKAQLEASKIVKEAFTDLAKVVFAQNPELKGFRWTQYTPYFNDGDSCEFNVHDFEINHPGDEYNKDRENEEDEDSEYHDWVSWYDAPEGYTSTLRKAYDSVREFFRQFDESDLEEMFGDHVRVKVTPEGVDVDEYSHD